MDNNKMLHRVSPFVLKKIPIIIFVGLLFVFAVYTVYLSLNLQTGIIPDETYRFEVSRYFVNTWGIPDNVQIIETTGESLHQGPFLGYWIYGRMLALFLLFNSSASEWQTLVFLRLVNAIFSWGTVIVTFLIAKEIIKNKWLQILPVFMLTNTLMFVFLSGGVNYDNPSILFSSLSLLFLIRVIKGKSLIDNSLAWLIAISIATLIKHSILPLAFIMSVIYLGYIVKNKPKLGLGSLLERKRVFLFITVLILLFMNIRIYGINIIRYQKITPSCYDVYSNEICDVSAYVIRHREMALPERLSIAQAFRQGDPEPIRYIFDYWFRAMLDRIYGIMGHKVYFPISVSYFLLMIYWTIGLGLRYIRHPNFLTSSLIGIIIFYGLVLVWMNYRSELVYGFHTSVALQGRYIFPVISIAYAIWGSIFEKVSNRYVRYATLFALVSLFLYGGPIRFLLYNQSVFADWFI